MGRENLVGRRFDRLLVVAAATDLIAPNGNSHPRWECLCDCGNGYTAFASNLRGGRSRSCGCLRKDRHPQTHGQTGSPEYRCWKSMKERCYTKTSTSYPLYGGRGITVCDQWLGDGGFQKFLDDIGPRPSLDHSVDRIDNDGNYEPSNCRWATNLEQSNNRRTCTMLSAFGRTQSIAAWAREIGIPYWTLSRRVAKNTQSAEDMLTSLKN